MKPDIKTTNNGIKDVVSYVKEYGFNVGVFSTKEDSENTIQGYIAVSNDKREIGVFRGIPYRTQKFLVIYLFSSYILNGNDELFADIVYNESIYDEEVYNFTLDLLMPDQHFRKLLDQSKENMKLLTDEYNLSRVMIEEKIKRLKKEK